MLDISTRRGDLYNGVGKGSFCMFVDEVFWHTHGVVFFSGYTFGTLFENLHFLEVTGS